MPDLAKLGIISTPVIPDVNVLHTLPGDADDLNPGVS